MTSSRLPRHYDALTPWERLPLIIAASARGDDVEVDRLTRSAPRHALRVPDYWGLAEGLKELVAGYLLQQLDQAALYWQLLVSVQQEPPLGTRSAQRQHRQRQEYLSKLSRMMAYRIMVRADGWRQLCAELSIDPDVQLRELPGYDTLMLVEAQVRLNPLTAEVALAYHQEHFPGRQPENEPSSSRREYRMATAADLARSMREFLQERRDAWR